jgi:ribose transport system substrate-binding protein
VYTELTTFERQRTIVKLVEERSSVKVDDLAKLFEVSEGTIRNDLTALESQDALTRIRGGAIAKNGLELPEFYLGQQTQPNRAAKQRIARWAADLVRDGDVIFLDASTTVMHMASYLREQRNITVITNQLECARLLAKDSSKTVILTGGILSTDGLAVTGWLSQETLKDLHIKIAFLSCSAMSLDVGLMESSLESAHFKEQVVSSSRQIVALVDSSKINTVSLRPFARLEQLHHLITDDALSPPIIEHLRTLHVPLTICGETTVQSLSPLQKKANYKIAFANLSEDIPFAVDVRRSLEEAAQHHDIDLILADNALSAEKAVQIADNLTGQAIDLLIEYQIDASASNRIVNRFQRHGIPIIAVDIPMVGATFFGVNNYQAGHIAGESLGTWIQDHWQGDLDYLLILEEKRAGALPAARIQGQLEGLSEVISSRPRQTFYLDSGNTSEVSYQHVLETLKALEPGRLAVISFNDDAALGAMYAMRELAWKDVAIVGQGADRMVRSELRKQDSSIIGSTAFHPEHYGSKILELAFKLLRGEAVPPAVYVECNFINAGNVNTHYPDEV